MENFLQRCKRPYNTSLFGAIRKTFSYLRLPIVLALTTMAASCPPQPVPPPKPGSWLVFLCQASDNTSAPHPVSFYQELFSDARTDLVTGFFRTMSENTVDLSGTEVYGWFKMTVNTAALDPATRNVTTNPGRSQTAQDCRAAGAAALLAQGKNIDPSKYAGFIAVVNVNVDAGATGKNVVANNSESASFYQHEILHTMGMPHSNRMAPDTSSDHSYEAGIDKVYEDPWDIMSFRRFIYENPVPDHDISGPGLQIAYRQKLGWVQANRIFVKDTADRTPSTITLAPVSETSRPGFLMARIDIAGGGTYVVEFRTFSNFDNAFPRPAVVVRELRQNGETYLVSRMGAAEPYTNVRSNGFLLGETFTDIGNFLSIKVDALTADAATITINPIFAPPANLGDVCGNKYVGQIRPCPANSICDARRRPPLVTIDYFCQ